MRESEFSISGGSGETGNVADVFDASDHHHQSFEAQAEPSVRDGAVSSQIKVPPVVLLVELEFLDSALDDLKDLLSLRPTDDLSNFRGQNVKGSNCLAILVLLHVEGFEVLRVVVKDDGSTVDVIAKVSLVLRSKVDSPDHFVLEDHSL